MNGEKIAILHYDVAPVVGGVESVVQQQAQLFLRAGYQVTLFGGRGEQEALPEGCRFHSIAEMDTQHPHIKKITAELSRGRIPADFEPTVARLTEQLLPLLAPFDHVISHNIMSTYFNLPLTTALVNLLDGGRIHGHIAWCHDITWTSTHSGNKVFPGYPWDALRTYRPDTTWVTVSRQRQEKLAGLFGVPLEQVRVVYNGAEPDSILGLSPEGRALTDRLGTWTSDLVLLLPVRVTQAKNLEFAIRVMAALRDEDLRPLLIITGPPDPHDSSVMQHFKELKELRRKLRLEQQVCFVYESGPQPGEGYIIDERLVGELYRVSDALLMPSHYEGFGMPVLEAGLAGIPVFCSKFPAGQEIGRGDIHMFETTDEPGTVAGMIREWAESDPVQRFRRRVRQRYTWEAIFENDILPLLGGEERSNGKHGTAQNRPAPAGQPGGA